MTHAEGFNKWYSERMGHPFAVQLGKNAVDELQQENAELLAALEIMVLQFESEHNCEYEFKVIKLAKDLINKND